MRNATNVEVRRAIVHIVDNRENEPILSAADLPLTESKPLGEYFSSQVANALHDAQTSSAVFSTDAEPTAGRQGFRILKDGDSFIPASQELVRLPLPAL